MSKKYEVLIIEHLTMRIEVKAGSRDEAQSIAERQWKDSELTLNADNFDHVEFTARPLEKNRDDYER